MVKVKRNSFDIIVITILTNVEKVLYKEKDSEALQEKNEILFEKKKIKRRLKKKYKRKFKKFKRKLKKI